VRKSKPVRTVSPLDSVNSDVDVDAPEIFLDGQYHIWVVYSFWQWPQLGPVKDELPWFCRVPCNIGGNEGIGLTMSRPVTTVDPTFSYSMSYWSATNYFPKVETAAPSDANRRHVAAPIPDPPPVTNAV